MRISVVKATLLTILALPFITLTIYYAMLFYPYLDAIKSISSTGLEAVSQIESRIYPLAVAAETKPLIRAWAMRQSYSNLYFKLQPRGMSRWHLDNTLWLFASYIHFNDNEVFGIWAECAFAKCEHDLNAAALSYFGKPLAELSDDQLAELVAAVKSPKMFAPGSERGQNRAKLIAEKSRST